MIPFPSSGATLPWTMTQAGAIGAVPHVTMCAVVTIMDTLAVTVFLIALLSTTAWILLWTLTFACFMTKGLSV